LATTAAVVGAADASGAGVGTTVVGAVGGALVHSVEARAFWIHDVLRALRGFVVANINGVTREDATTFHSPGLRLTGIGTEAPEDISGH